jgi:hypothetical protein
MPDYPQTLFGFPIVYSDDIPQNSTITLGGYNKATVGISNISGDVRYFNIDILGMKSVRILWQYNSDGEPVNARAMEIK